MKAKHIVLSTLLYGAISLGMLTIEAPEENSASWETGTTLTSGTSEQFFAQAVPGERRRVRRRTRRRVKRRTERRENATGFAMNFSKTFIA